jgi:hypothetical protein
MVFQRSDYSTTWDKARQLLLSAFFILLQETINRGMPIEDFMWNSYATGNLRSQLQGRPRRR